MKTATERIFSQAELRGFGLWTTAILAFGLGFFYNMSSARAEEPRCGDSKLDAGEKCDSGISCSEKCECPKYFTPDGNESAPGCSDPCGGVAFSEAGDADTVKFGCSVAAALHYGGTSMDSVRSNVARYNKGKGGEKWMQRFNKALRKLAKDTFWGTFSHSFGKSEIMGWDDAAFIEKLLEAANRLDAMHQQRRTDLKVRTLVKSARDLKAGEACPPPSSGAPAPDPTPPPSGGTEVP